MISRTLNRRVLSRVLAFRHAAALMIIWLVASGVVQGQSVCLPLPRLLSIEPMGGQSGTTFDITVAGENIEEAGELIFEHPGISAVAKRDAQGNLIPNQYTLTIAPEVPMGLVEARITSRLGISSARIFSVGNLPELIQKPGNTSLATALALTVPSVCNATVSARAVDYYSFDAEAGKRYLVHCGSRGIDSKLDPVVILGDANGGDLIAQRTGDVIDFIAKSSGKHTIKVHELTFKGGQGYFYRLTLQELPLDAPVPVFPVTRNVSSFSWPPTGLAAHAAMKEEEEKDVQAIQLPLDIEGRFYPAADTDTYEFTAQAGESWWIEVASERLGRPTDPSVLVQMLKPNTQDWMDVIELNDIVSPMKPSSNGYAYDGPPFDGGSTDVLGKLEIKESGTYRLSVTDLFGGTRKDPRNRYRLVIRKSQPDFAVVSWGLHMELRNGDRNALSKPLALRAGSTVALEVVAVRRDGFDGEIALSMEGLPAGVRAAGLKIPAGKMRGIVLLTASQDAPQGMSNATLTSSALVGDQTQTHPVQMAQMVWPVVDSWGEIPATRLVSGIPVSVTTSEVAPLSLASTEGKVFEVKQGETITVPLTHTLRSEFSGSVLQLKTFGPGWESNPPFDISLSGNRSEAKLHSGVVKAPPGEYTIAFYGAAVAKYRYNPFGVNLAEGEVRKAEEALQKVVAELMQKTQQAAGAAVEQKAAADAEVAEWTKRKMEAEKVLAVAKEQLKQAQSKAEPRDTAEIIVSEPVTVRVLPPG
jgi:hypothetical protein